MTHSTIYCAAAMMTLLIVAPSLFAQHSTTMASAPRMKRNVSYGPAPAQKMDVYAPPNAKGAPVILMVHGGGWYRGDKVHPPVVKNKVPHWTSQGFVFISINYRMLPQTNPWEQAEDVAQALAYAQRHAESWGGDPDKFILMGHSAGGHLVMLLSADPSITQKQDARSWLGTVCLDSGAYNIPAVMRAHHLKLYDDAFGGDSDFWEKVSPFHRLTPNASPMLLVCSSRRPAAHLHATEFVAKARHLGVNTMLRLENLSHAQINEQLGLDSEYTRQVDEFLQSLLQHDIK